MRSGVNSKDDNVLFGVNESVRKLIVYANRFVKYGNANVYYNVIKCLLIYAAFVWLEF